MYNVILRLIGQSKYMNHNESGSSRIIFTAILAIIGACALIFSPDSISTIWKILGWIAIAVCIILAGVLHHKDKSKKLLAEKELLQKRRKRRKHLDQERLEQEKRIEKSKKKLAEKEEKLNEKRTKIKQALVVEAQTTWAGRVEYASSQENAVRKIIEKTNKMHVRTLAGQVAIEWNEASGLSQWTMQQILMYSQRPNVTMEAREDAQEAIIEAMRIKDSGGNWTKEKGEELAKIKEKAREEAMIEEDRLDTIKNTIERAELKWNATETRVFRLQQELDSML